MNIALNIAVVEWFYEKQIYLDLDTIKILKEVEDFSINILDEAGRFNRLPSPR